MIKSSKSIFALFFLFICFISSTRYLQKLIFDRDLLNTFYTKIYPKKQLCNPKKDSIIEFFEENNFNSLIIIMDAYPNKKIYQEITGLNSEFHKYLKSISTDSHESQTSIATTQLSLPYLLGKIPLNNNCRYPFLGGNFKPRLLLNHELIQSKEGVCPNSYEYSSRNSFVRYFNRFREKIDKNYKNGVKQILNNCSIANTKTTDLIINSLKKTNLKNVKNRINIAHEFKFHRNDSFIIKSNHLPKFDNEYFKGIKYLVTKLKNYNLVDEIIVMNDHGPRTDLFGDRANDDFQSKSLIDQNYHGIFIYKIPIKVKSKKRLAELIPKAKERYLQNSFGKIIKLNNFIYQN